MFREYVMTLCDFYELDCVGVGGCVWVHVLGLGLRVCIVCWVLVWLDSGTLVGALKDPFWDGLFRWCVMDFACIG